MRQKTTLLLFTFVFLIASTMSAKQISKDEAKKLALNTISQSVQKRNSQELQLVYTATGNINNKGRNSAETVNLYYVFNIGNNNGFVITSADDINVPIIGRSNQGEYNSENLPDNFREWMTGIELGMVEAISQGSEASDYVKQKWNEYNSVRNSNEDESQEVILPFTSKWNQTRPFNNMTPIVDGTATYTGCVATAMAQVMKYYEYPKTFNETVTIPAYTSSTLALEIPEINMTGNVFDWDSMLDVYDYWGDSDPQQTKDAVAKLMYYCGASVNMNYGLLGTTGSGAVTQYVANALTDFFDYDKSIGYKNRSNYLYEYSEEEWAKLLRTEINEGRPVLISAASSSGGHAFICYGYNADDEFYFNWGWGGDYDGYYEMNAPMGYSLRQAAMVNIKPNEGGEPVAEFFVRSLNNYPESIRRNEPFRLECSVSDNSMHYLSTDFDIALYDDEDNFVSIISFIKYSVGWSSSQKKCRIPETVAPGTYKLKAVLEQEDGTYIAIPRAVSLEADPTIVVDEKIIMHTLKIRNNTVMTSTISSGEAGDEVTLKNISYGNHETESFSGSLGIALANEESRDIEYVLFEQAGHTVGSYYYYTNRAFQGTLPDDVLPGNYLLMMCAKQTDKEWSVVEALDETVVDHIPFTVTGVVTGIEDAKEDEVKIYPNPVKDILHIQANENIAKTQLYNTAGKLVIEQENSNNIDVRNLNSGIYILKVETQSGTSTHKINKQ